MHFYKISLSWKWNMMSNIGQIILWVCDLCKFMHFSTTNLYLMCPTNLNKLVANTLNSKIIENENCYVRPRYNILILYEICKCNNYFTCRARAWEAVWANLGARSTILARGGTTWLINSVTVFPVVALIAKASIIKDNWNDETFIGSD